MLFILFPFIIAQIAGKMSLITFLMVFMTVSFMFFVATIFASIYPFLVWRNVYYIITDKRLIVRKGVVGTDYDILDLEYIQHVSIGRGFRDKVYNTASLRIKAIGVSSISVYCIPEYEKFHHY